MGNQGLNTETLYVPRALHYIAHSMREEIGRGEHERTRTIDGRSRPAGARSNRGMTVHAVELVVNVTGMPPCAMMITRVTARCREA